MSRRSRRRATTWLATALKALVVAIVAIVGAACGDGARDAAFRGEPLGHVQGLHFDGEVFGIVFEGDTGTGRIRGGIMWSGPGVAPLLDERGELALRAEGTFDITVYAPPPARFLRAAARGAFALGQVALYADRDADGARGAGDDWIGRTEMLVAWSPSGASGGAVLGELPPGLSIVWAGAPCDVAPVQVFLARPNEPMAIATQPDLPASALFGDPGCAAALDDEPGACRSLPGARWWCRHGPATAALCDRCEYQLFPQGADAARCDAWYARCVARGDQYATEPECWAEWRVCLGGEAPASRACDVACACDNLTRHCASAEPFLPQCADVPGCDWEEP